MGMGRFKSVLEYPSDGRLLGLAGRDAKAEGGRLGIPGKLFALGGDGMMGERALAVWLGLTRRAAPGSPTWRKGVFHCSSARVWQRYFYCRRWF